MMLTHTSVATLLSALKVFLMACVVASTVLVPGVMAARGGAMTGANGATAAATSQMDATVPAPCAKTHHRACGGQRGAITDHLACGLACFGVALPHTTTFPSGGTRLSGIRPVVPAAISLSAVGTDPALRPPNSL